MNILVGTLQRSAWSVSWQPPLFISLGYGKTFFLEMLDQNPFVVWCPAIPVTFPTGVTAKDTSIECQLVTFVSVWSVLVLISTHGTRAHKLLFHYHVSFLFRTSAAKVTGPVKHGVNFYSMELRCIGTFCICCFSNRTSIILFCLSSFLQSPFLYSLSTVPVLFLPNFSQSTGNASI